MKYCDLNLIKIFGSHFQSSVSIPSIIKFESSYIGKPMTFVELPLIEHINDDAKP